MKKILLFLTLVTIYGLSPAQSITDSLVGYYKFDGNANDFSGNGNNGEPTDISYIADRTGAASKAASFNGSSSKILTTLKLDSLTAYTVCAWLKIPAGGGGILTNHRGLTGDGDGFSLGNKQFGLDGDHKLREIEKIGAIPPDTWYHIAGVWEDTIGSTIEPSQMKLYINGTLVNDINVLSAINTTTVPFSINTAMAIGQHTQGGQMFKGDVDELLIYKRALAQNEIELVYTNGIPAIDLISVVDPTENYLIDGNYYSIQWTTEGSISNFDIEYSINNGKNWTQIATNQTNKTYNWLVPSVTTDSLIIRVSKTGTPSINDITIPCSIIKDELLHGLIVWYPFNYDNDTLAADSSGHNNNGQVSGASLLEVANKDKAFSFDGYNDIIEIPNIPHMEELTFTAWYKTSNSIGAIYSLPLAGYISIDSYFGGYGGRILAEIEGPQNTMLADTLATNDNEWHFVALVVSTDSLKLYVDNRSYAVNFSGDINYLGNTSVIGSWDEVALYYKGLIDNVRIYSLPLSKSVIEKVYNSDLNNNCSVQLVHVDAGPDMIVCNGLKVTLNAKGNADSYTWNNNVVNNVPFKPQVSGNYIVTATTTNGCVATDTMKITVESCSNNLTDAEFSSKMVVFPNPTTGLISINNTSGTEILSVKVYNAQGAIIAQYGSSNSIDLSHVNNGIYFIQIQTNNKLYTQRILLEK